MRNLLLFITVIGAMLLAACGGDNETAIDSTVKTNEEQTTGDTATENATETETEGGEEAAPAEEEVSEVIVDDANVTITYQGTTTQEDDIFGKTASIKFQIVNKLGNSIEVQSRELSTDNVMVDETLIAYSETVAAGKTANTSIEISEYEGYDFPTFNENIELTLIVMNGDTWDTIAEYPVNISVK
ncbi:hypothetical protein [Ureibacillus sp. GCM10028918]|uniref:hypothetical protein n=1 Tax=Ureibacillus sp. GCM10028918 TaxID=3273429 RepID=UPI003613C62A